MKKVTLARIVLNALQTLPNKLNHPQPPPSKRQGGGFEAFPFFRPTGMWEVLASVGNRRQPRGGLGGVGAFDRRTLRLGLIVLFLVSACQQNSNDHTQKARAEHSNIVTASGELASEDTAELGPPLLQFMRGLKVSFMAEEGKAVKKGLPVVGFDNSQQKQELLTKQSELATAQQKRDNTLRSDEEQREMIRLQAAEARMKQQKTTRKLEASQQLVARIEIQKLELDLQVANDEVQRTEALIKHHEQAMTVRRALANADVARLQADVDRVQGEIKRMMVKASKDGLVVHKNNWEGNKIAVGDSVYWGQSIIEIPSLDKMIVRAEIKEVDARAVQIGQSADIVLDAQPDKTFHGKIKSLGQSIRPRSREEPTPVFDAVVALDEIDASVMRPGMAARLTINTGDANSSAALTVKN